MKKIAIIGHGYVGKAVTKFFKDHFEVMVYDPMYIEKNSLEEKRDGNVFFTTDKEKINTCDLGVICVPTPMGEDGVVDLSIVNKKLEWLDTSLILIKSTVPPGTTQGLIDKHSKEIVFSPEFIGEGNYVVPWWKDKGYPHPTDMKYHDFQIFGGKRETTGKVLEFFKRVLGPDAKYIQTDNKTAELVKYMENSWLATKVTFCNEFANLADSFGVDYNELRELWLLDGRVSRMHTAVFKDNRGFGGKCLPKDVNGIVKASEKAGYEPELLKSVLNVNKKLL